MLKNVEKCLLGRIIQFSYLTGAKKERQYSSNFVDLSKESYKSIGVYANWFQGTRALNNQDANEVSFKLLTLYSLQVTCQCLITSQVSTIQPYYIMQTFHFPFLLKF